MSEMTLPSRHRIQNSSSGGLRPSTLLPGHGGYHNTMFYERMWKKHFGFFQTAETGKRTPNSGVKGSGATHYPRTPPKGQCTGKSSEENVFNLLERGLLKSYRPKACFINQLEKTTTVIFFKSKEYKECKGKCHEI